MPILQFLLILELGLILAWGPIEQFSSITTPSKSEKLFITVPDFIETLFLIVTFGSIVTFLAILVS